jgi:hypothetical protein
MIAFFLIPISRMMHPHRDPRQVGVRDHQGQQGADAGGRQRGQDRDRMDVALVEHAEHDEHGRKRGSDQQRLAPERLLVGFRRAGEHRVDRRREPDRRGRTIDRAHGIAERHARGELKGDCHGRENGRR